MSALPSVLKRRQRMLANAWRPLYQTKYYVLIAFLVLSAFGVLQVGLLDPIALTVRTFAVDVFPGLQLAGAAALRGPALLPGRLADRRILFVLILAANRFVDAAVVPDALPPGRAAGAGGQVLALSHPRDPRALPGLPQVHARPATAPASPTARSGSATA